MRSTEIPHWNSLRSLFREPGDWTAWVRPALQKHLKQAAHTVVHIGLSQAAAGGQTTTKEFRDPKIIRLGRLTAAEDVFPLSSLYVPPDAAEIQVENGQYYFVCAPFPLGARVRGEGIKPGVRHALGHRDRFGIGPYEFEFTLTVDYAEETVELAGGEPTVLTAVEFRKTAAKTSVTVPVRLPFPGSGVELQGPDGILTEAVVGSLVEAANRRFQFPVMAEQAPARELGDMARGFVFPITVKLSSVTVQVRLFVAVSLVHAIAAAAKSTTRADGANPAVSDWLWHTAGAQSLSVGELSTLEAGSVVRLEPGSEEYRLVYSRKRWKPSRPGDGAANWEPVPERVPGWEGRDMSSSLKTGALDLETIPVLVQVILGKKEIPLAQLRELNPGQIFPLDQPVNAPVEIALNGKILGTGQLEILDDGLVGVKVIGWEST